MMDELRFEPPVGAIPVSHRAESLALLKGLGAHALRLELEVRLPAVAEAGRVLTLESDLYAPTGTGSLLWLGSAAVTVPFEPGAVEQPRLQYVLPNTLVRALEERRRGSLHLELHIRAVLPQASVHPGCPDLRLRLDVAEGHWLEQLEGLGRSLGVEMLLPFPAPGRPGHKAADHLLEAQRRLRQDDIDGALSHARHALDHIDRNSGWGRPGKKPKRERDVSERWSVIRKAIQEQTTVLGPQRESADEAFTHTRADVETVITLTAALAHLIGH
ncbi:hypothetical protein ACFYNX_10610 [Streptomyces sp. NPDC007872]|uniref:hypothetical protein n=1 Tax=Streptomyces sp. NPDC007872 TaxID=3364782 RepID=UPI0036A3557E